MPNPLEDSASLGSVLLVTAHPEMLKDFTLTKDTAKAMRSALGITPQDVPSRIMSKVHEGFRASPIRINSGALGIEYTENNGLVKSPEEVLSSKDRRGDCDEVTRAAYAVAYGNGVKNLVLVEMKWAESSERSGHAVLILLPEKQGDRPLLFDFTIFRDAVLLESSDIDSELRGIYADFAAKPGFGMKTRSNLNEVEASHYEQVGEYYNGKNWKLTAEAYALAVNLVPSEPRYVWGLAVAYEKQGRYKDAITSYSDYMKFPEVHNNPKLFSTLGSCYCLDGQYEIGIRLLENALNLKPDKDLFRSIEDNPFFSAMKFSDQLEKQGKHEEAEKMRQKAKLYGH